MREPFGLNILLITHTSVDERLDLTKTKSDAPENFDSREFSQCDEAIYCALGARQDFGHLLFAK
jgi:hypothetical protein